MNKPPHRVIHDQARHRMTETLHFPVVGPSTQGTDPSEHLDVQESG